MSENKVYSDELTGILSKNNQKREGKQDPDIRGRAKIAGIWYWQSGWLKQSANGPFYSMSYTEMSASDAEKYEAKTAARNAPQQRNQQQQSNQQTPPARQEGEPNPDEPMDFDDDIPF